MYVDVVAAGLLIIKFVGMALIDGKDLYFLYLLTLCEGDNHVMFDKKCKSKLNNYFIQYWNPYLNRKIQIW